MPAMMPQMIRWANVQASILALAAMAAGAFHARIDRKLELSSRFRPLQRAIHAGGLQSLVQRKIEVSLLLFKPFHSWPNLPQQQFQQCPWQQQLQESRCFAIACA